MMNRYAIIVDGKTVDYLTAENAESAAREYSAKMGPDSDLGIVRGVKMVDADTRGEIWAIIKTAASDITAIPQLVSDRYGVWSVYCGDGTRIDVHMTDNAWRGRGDVTLTRVATAVPRPAHTRQYKQADIIAQTRTSGRCGHWSLSQRVREELGLE